jgi:3-methyladenine DNA glycosylase AlkD
MGKITSIYLTPEEDAALRAYCDKHGCTPHSVIKAGLHWMLEEIKKHDDVDLTRALEEKKSQDQKPSETKRKSDLEKFDLAQLLKLLRESEEKR